MAVLLVAACSVSWLGCSDVEKALQDAARNAAQQAAEQQTAGRQQADGWPAQPTTLEPAGGGQTRQGETIRIASFNIQVFGKSKMSKPDVVDTLVKVVRNFDIVAIQEIRSKDQSILPTFTARLNADGSRYDFVIGPRQGRTSSKEQYAYVFDTSRVAVIPNSAYVTADPGAPGDDYLHREPLAARFQTVVNAPHEPFTFTLVNIHTDPDETDIELDALDDVYVAVQNDGSGEDDVILLGDLNVDEDDLGELGRLPHISWVVRGQPTNTRRSASYDNLVFDPTKTVEFTGYGGVFEFDRMWGLTEEQALDVSDHLPVWAEFGIYENRSGAMVASRGRQSGLQ